MTDQLPDGKSRSGYQVPAIGTRTRMAGLAPGLASAHSRLVTPSVLAVWELL